MSRKPDISTGKLLPWDRYEQKSPHEAAQAVYERVAQTSLAICAWYWSSIRAKRRTSMLVRACAFSGLVAGTALPIFAALQKTDADKLLLTQWAVALLAISGLLVVADRVFGWSSGWMRYITTVTAMENLTRAFQIEWRQFLINKSAPLESGDARSLFELGAGLEQELVKLQAEETTKWCAEFNTGISLLEILIKTQREATDKQLESLRTSVSTQQKSMAPGATEATLLHQGEPQRVMIALDKGNPD